MPDMVLLSQNEQYASYAAALLWDVSPSFEQGSSPKDNLCQVCLIWPTSGSRVEVANVKVYKQTDGQPLLRKAHLSFQLGWDNKSSVSLKRL
jgi:hypothetical protein